ncbi:aminoglycoside phosphotransferase family protein [Cellulosimicrobium sp. Marseille-Q4280]|uniref:aminoglycoside phosphotransferase family protein n=1 Tax=Cellulosimicrobium sp. Marseille-Q4280 TaxID=2937992 RepID=UPI00203FABFD|nr:aminoglycoside phosphotransferase family protein [Cellulosimicrobium sp. Marseille-Q4280]
MPSAEADVTVDLARALLTAQHPDLAGLPIVVAASGWDNVVLRLGDDLALRLPRRAAAAQLVENEQRWLPALAPSLPVAVPAPVRVGRPSDGSVAPVYPWSWSVVPWFDGVPAWRVEPAARHGLAGPLADVVAALHVPAPEDAPANPYRGVPLATRDAAVRERLASGAVPEPGPLLDLWSRLCGTPDRDGPAVWLHGDLHPANLIATPGDGPSAAGAASLAAVVDFGDVTSGDPATDLATAWLTFDPPARATFRDRVTTACGTDDATWDRSLAWAVLFTSILLSHSDDAPHLRAIGEQALAQVLAEE